MMVEKEITKELKKFAKSRPYFEEVRFLMGKLMVDKYVSNLEEAYETAIWMNKKTRRQLMVHFATIRE